MPLLKVLGWRALAGFAAALVLVSALLAAYARGRSDGREACEAKYLAAAMEAAERAREDERRAQDLADALGRRISDEISRIRIEHRTVQQTIRDEVREVPVYGECRISDRLLDALNAYRTTPDPGAEP